MSQTTTQITPDSCSAGPDLQQVLRERDELIEQIRRHNSTVKHAFLAQFGNRELADYLDHLKHARQKHIRLPGWVQRRSAALAEARRSLKKVA